MEIRNLTTGLVSSEKEFRQSMRSTSLPRKLTDDMLRPFGLVIIQKASITVSKYEIKTRDGEELIDGTWYEKWIAENVSIDTARKIKTQELSLATFNTLNIGFTCMNGIMMDAEQESVDRFEKGVELALKLGEPTMYIIDFNNFKHVGIELAVAEDMIKELSVNLRNLHETYADMRTLISTATWEVVTG